MESPLIRILWQYSSAGQARSSLVLLLLGSLILTPSSVTAEPNFTYVDLQPKANHRLVDDLDHSEGSSLVNLPQGEQKFGGKRWLIGEKLIHLRGAHLTELPDKVDGIKVDAAFDRMFLLHSTEYGEVEPLVADGTEIGYYTVHYADDSTIKIPINYGEDLRDWWDWPPRTSLKRANIAWTGTSPLSEQNQRKIRLYSVAWDNPHPEKQVTTLDFHSNSLECDPFLVAVTLQKG